MTREVFPDRWDMFPFTLLIAEETGLPVESVHELSLNCLTAVRNGQATLSYVKRRAGTGTRTLTVRTGERFSAGWLIETWRLVSANARLFAPQVDQRFLFVGISAKKCKRLLPHNKTASYFFGHHEVRDDAGERMSSLDMRRIRKTAKAATYRRIGGDIKLFADDNSPQVAATHYARIAANVEIHEAAIEKGLEAALRGPLATTVVTAPTDPRGEGPAPVGDDLAVAQCLDFENSPFSAPGMPCGAPLLGCLDCANAVVTDAKLPALFHLLHDLVRKRQEMQLGAWVAAFGGPYARILTILDRFPEATLAAALEDAEASFGRSWSPIQLALKV